MTRWAAGLAASVALHVAVGAGLALAFRPVPPGPGEGVSAELSMAGEPVPETRAAPTEPEADSAGETDAAGEVVGTTAVPRARAEAEAPPAETLPEAATAGERATAAEAPADALGAALPRSDAVAAAAPVAPPQAAETPETATIVPASPETDGLAAVSETSAPLAAVAAEARAAQAGEAPSDRLSASLEAGASLTSATVEGARLAGVGAEAPALAASAPADQRLAVAQPVTAPPAAAAALPSAAVPARLGTADPIAAAAAVGTPAASRAPADAAEAADNFAANRLAMAPPPEDISGLATVARAGLAWAGGEEARFDALSLATVQSFMSPKRARDAQTGGDVRDGISEMLAGVPCARLQAAFVPETGALEIRGHVPRPEMRAEVEARLQAMIGGAIDVGNDILVLPEPQCDVLSGIEGLGLPQSTDQADDPLTVGEAAQAAILTFYGGQTLSIPITETADYDAYLYIDYYDADGNVLHLVPNEQAALRYFEAKSRVVVGGTDGSFGGLTLTVSPPFGRDIFVVLATTEPLYEGLRPVVEPAEPYLDFVRDRLAELRERAGFKGEWVYLFIDTAAN